MCKQHRRSIGQNRNNEEELRRECILTMILLAAHRVSHANSTTWPLNHLSALYLSPYDKTGKCYHFRHQRWQSSDWLSPPSGCKVRIYLWKKRFKQSKYRFFNAYITKQLEVNYVYWITLTTYVLNYLNLWQQARVRKSTSLLLLKCWEKWDGFQKVI